MAAVGFSAATAWLCGGVVAQTPPRDRAAAQPVPAGTAAISGHVVAADTGRPVKRARVVVSSTQLGGRGRQAAAALLGALADARGQGGRMPDVLQPGSAPGAALLAGLRVVQAVQTDDQGRYEVKGLPAGRYLVSASKTGFVTVNFGQRRPLRPGTPVELADGQHVQGINILLPRGSVITGHILDEDGEPLSRASVTVWRYQYQGGERRLVAAGSDQTDDRGEYRVYGLPPGEYYVSAVVRVVARPVERLLQLAGSPTPPVDEDTLGYAPTYYPGVTTAAQATPLALALGQEAANVDFQLQLVKLARVSGTVFSSDGTPLAGGVVLLAPDEAGAARADTITGRARPDGAFSIENVPPGRYTLFARNRPGRDAPPDYAVMPVVVAGADVTNLSVVLMPGATVSGSITFDPNASTTPPALAGVRVTVPALDPLPVAGNQPARVNDDGTFTISGIPPGRHAIRAPNPPPPWALQAVLVDGRDVADEAIELRAGQRVTGVQVVLTDRITELTGSVKDERGDPVLGFTVIAFSTDAATWRAQSRRIQAVQPDQTGAFRIRGLPPGGYYLVATDDVEPGEWFDADFLREAQKSAVRVTLADGQTTVQDLTARTGGGPGPS